MPGGITVDIRALSSSAGRAADLLRYISLYEQPGLAAASEASFELVSDPGPVESVRAPPPHLVIRFVCPFLRVLTISSGTQPGCAVPPCQV